MSSTKSTLYAQQFSLISRTSIACRSFLSVHYELIGLLDQAIADESLPVIRVATAGEALPCYQQL